MFPELEGNQEAASIISAELDAAGIQSLQTTTQRKTVTLEILERYQSAIANTPDDKPLIFHREMNKLLVELDVTQGGSGRLAYWTFNRRYDYWEARILPWQEMPSDIKDNLFQLGIDYDDDCSAYTRYVLKTQERLNAFAAAVREQKA
jgi:hypothetical protein